MTPTEFLDQAAQILTQRGKTYGSDIEESFTRAAKLASLKLNKDISAYDVATVLESVKDARLAVSPNHWDSHVDGINYRAFRGQLSGAVKPTDQPAEPAPVPGLVPVTTYDPALTPKASQPPANWGTLPPGGVVTMQNDPAPLLPAPTDVPLPAAPVFVTNETPSNSSVSSPNPAPTPSFQSLVSRLAQPAPVEVTPATRPGTPDEGYALAARLLTR